MVSLSGKSIALCGNFDSFNRSLLQGAIQKIWSPTIDYLILGTDYETKWKYKQATRLSIPTIMMSLLNATTEKTESLLWADTYKPTKLADVIGHKTQIQDLQKWLKHWSTNDKYMRAAFVTGPPGIGKTTVAHLLCKECDYDIIELNASNERSATAVRKWFAESSRAHHIGKRRVIIMDEVDGMSSGDRGGIGELARIIKTCSFPIICIANERTTPRLRPLVACCLDIRFSRPTRTTIAQSIYRIVKEKDTKKNCMTVGKLEELCERNGNDIRSILNYLQFSVSSAKDELLRVDAFSATGRVFGKRGTIDERMNLVFTDFSLIPLMVGEGYIAAAGKGADSDSQKLLNCAHAADALGVWDIIDTRIRKTQNWGLLPSSVMAVVEVATVANGPAPFQIFPSWLGKHSKRMKHMRQLRQISRNSLDERDVLRLRLFKDGLTPSETVTRLLSYNLTRDDMLDTLIDTAFTGDESAVALDTKFKTAITREWNKRIASNKQVSKETDKDIEDIEYVDSDADIDFEL